MTTVMKVPRLTFVVVAGALGVVLSVCARAEKSANASAFQAWATDFARSHDVAVERWGTAPLLPSGERVNIAWLCGAPDSGIGFLLLESLTSQRWAYSMDLVGRTTVCRTPPSTRTPRWQRLLDPTLAVDLGVHGVDEFAELAFRDGRPSLIRQKRSDSGERLGVASRVSFDWDRAQLQTTLDGAARASQPFIGDIITVMTQPPSSASVEHFLDGHRGSLPRATLQVAATATAGGEARLHITVHDARHVAVDGNGRGDRVRIWTCAEPDKGEACMRSFVIDATEHGWAATRGSAPGWRVAGSQDELLVTLPRAEFPISDDDWRDLLMSVELDDVEAPGDAVATRIATSTLDAHQPASLGLLVAHHGLRRWPSPDEGSYARLKPVTISTP